MSEMTSGQFQVAIWIGDPQPIFYGNSQAVTFPQHI
jgi:hypothetical protein